MTKALELAKFGRESPPAGTVVGDSDTQTLSSKTFSDGPVFSGLTANGVPFLNASKVLSSSGTFIFDGTNLGIGVASPAQKLDVNGTVKIGSGSGETLTLGSLDLGKDIGLADGYGIVTGNARVLTFRTSGNVGLGTASPAYKLEIATGTSGQQSLVGFRTADATAANNAGLMVFATPSATATSRSIVAVWDADGANSSGGDYFLINKNGNSGSVDLFQYSNAEMKFAANYIGRATVDMTLSAAGNLGLGTTPNTGAKFQVTGYTDFWNTTNTLLRVQHDGSRGRLQSYTSGGVGDIVLNPDGGNVGIGTTNPGALLEIAAGGPQLIFNANTQGTNFKKVRLGASNNAAGDFVLSAINDDNSLKNYMLYITNGGAVGIGTTNPVSPLHVKTGGTVFTVPTQNAIGGGTGSRVHFIGIEPGLMLSSDMNTANASQTGTGTASLGLQIGYYGANDVRSQLYWAGTPLTFVYGSNPTASPQERMRITATGQLLFGTTATPMAGSGAGVYINGVSNQQTDIASLFVSGAKIGFAGIQSLIQNQLTIYDSTAGNAAGTGGAITFGGNAGGGQATFYAAIESRKNNGTAGDYGASLNFYTRPTGSYYTAPNMIITSTGNVGIGTDNPTAKLTVKGQTHTAPWLAVERSDSGTLQFRIVNAENTGYTASTGTVSAPWTNVIDSSNSDLMLSSLFGGGTGGRIILDGKVGIGKTNPGVALDVVGNAQITTTAAGTYGLIAVGSSGGARDIFLAGQSGFSNGFTVRYDGAAMVYAFQDGNVCIGATTPFGNLGVAGSTNLGNNVASSQAAQYFTRLSGYAARYDASNRYGSYGQLIFHADDGWTGGARRWMITNVLNVTSFGIIRSATALTDPGLGDGGSVNSGTVDFAISNTGRISMGATGVSNNQAKLEITGGSLVVNSKGGGNRFQELQMVSGHVQAGGSTVWTTFMYSGPTFVGNIRVIAVDNRGQSFGCASWVGVANICYGGGSGPLVTQTAALSGSISAVNVIYNNSGYILQAAVTYSGATSGVTIYFSFDGNGSDAMYAEA